MKGKIKLNKTSTIYLAIPVLICLITLLLCGCTSTGKNETTTINKATDQVAKNDESGKSTTEDDQKIVCRNLHVTGSRFKNRVCVTKAEWAIRDGKNKEKLDEFDRDVSGRTGVNTGTGGDGMGGMSSGMPR
ncbi:MAG: hypothetical protein JW927_09135 [Deltaproteobacteria bacterium]|nr:hypothetical protein [Deltaproteobacteria bacterium]